MKYGIRNRSLNMDWKDALMAAGEIGYDGVELVVPDEEDIARLLTPEGRDEVLSWCEAANCAVSSLSVAPFRKHTFAQPDVDIDTSVGFVSDCLRACAALNAAGVLFPHFDRENIDVSAAEEAAFIEGFKRCAPLAEELDVCIALETTFSVEQLQRIVDGVGSPQVGVYHDVANALHYGHDPVDMFLRLGERIPMVHIKEKGGDFLGEGEVDWNGCIAAIDQIGYDGWLVLETRATDRPRAAAMKNLVFIRTAISEKGFFPLFNGSDIDDWRVIGPDTWKVEDGVIVCNGGRGWIHPEKMYEDFVLRLEYQIGQNGNSGIFLRTSEEGRPAYQGMEIQILDDHGAPPTDKSTGAIYDSVTPTKNMAKPASEWNTMEINCQGRTIQVWLNSEEIINENLDHHPDLKDRLQKGYIGLQNHNSPVAFRHVRIKEL